MSARTFPGDWREPREPYTGPRTGQQLSSIEVLEELAARQSVTAAAVLPAYDGPVTGELEQLPGDLGTPGRAVVDQAAGEIGAVPVRRERHPRARARLRHGWPLLAVLAVQAVLSLRLVWSNTAFQDEALYLWAGHLEWANWLHGTPIPLFPTYFSGAPVIYPPLGALADAIGGLAGARILSLCFMLGATALLWATASRLFGRRAAFFAAASWAALGPTQFLGAFATYDAMSLFLVTLAAWCAIHGTKREDATKWMLAAAGVLALANAAKYASALFDPVVAAAAYLTAIPQPGGKPARARGASLATYTAAVVIALATIGGGYYEGGITSTTLTRTPGSASAWTVLGESWEWTGAVLGVAVLGACLCIGREWRQRRGLLLAVLAAAGLLVPLEQARIHTTTSLHKHVDFGAWFAAIAAGYAIDRIITVAGPKPLRAIAAVACAAAVAAAGWAGMAQARELFAGGWPDATAFTAAFRPLADSTSGPLLVETASTGEYYLAAGTDWQRWSNTFSITLQSGRSVGYQGDITGAGNARTYGRYISGGYFALIALNFQNTPALDKQIAADLRDDKNYRLIKSVPYGAGRYLIWKYEPRRASAHHGRGDRK